MSKDDLPVGLIEIDGIVIDTETGEVVEHKALDADEGGLMQVLATRRFDAHAMSKGWGRGLALYDVALLGLLGKANADAVRLPDVGLMVRRNQRRNRKQDMATVANMLRVQAANARDMAELGWVMEQALALLCATSGITNEGKKLVPPTTYGEQALELVAKNTTIAMSEPWITTDRILKEAPAMELQLKEEDA